MKNLANTLKANTEVKEGGNFAIVLSKRNFYTKRIFTEIITTAKTYEEAKAIHSNLKKQYADEIKENGCFLSFATIDLFTRGSRYNFAKQS